MIYDTVSYEQSKKVDAREHFELCTQVQYITKTDHGSFSTQARHLAGRRQAPPDVGRDGGGLPLGEGVVQGGDDGRRVRHDGLDVLELEVAHGVAAVDELVQHLLKMRHVKAAT